MTATRLYRVCFRLGTLEVWTNVNAADEVELLDTAYCRTMLESGFKVAMSVEIEEVTVSVRSTV